MRSIYVVGERQDTAGSTYLNHVCAILVVKAHGVTSLIWSIDYTIQRIGLPSEEAGTKATAVVTMAAGRAERVHGNEHARPGHDTVANGVAQADIEKVAGANVTHGSETGHEGDAGVCAGVQGPFGNRFLQAVDQVLLPIV